MPVHIKINTIFVARLHLYLCGPLEAFVDIKIWSGKSVTAARRGFLSSFSQVVLGWKFWSGVKLLLGGGGKYPTDRVGKAVSTWDTGMCNAFASEFPCFSVFLLFLYFFFVFYWKLIPTVRPTAGPICLLACPIWLAANEIWLYV